MYALQQRPTNQRTIEKYASERAGATIRANHRARKWNSCTKVPSHGPGLLDESRRVVLRRAKTRVKSDDREDIYGPSDVVVVGAGPTGLSTAVMLARRGWSVRVLEKRNKPADCDSQYWGDPSRSYNIGLSARGQIALEKFDLLEAAKEYAVGVKGRCDFDKDGRPVERLVQKKFDTQVIQRDRLVAAFLNEIELKYKDKITVEHGVAVNSCTFMKGDDDDEVAKLEIFDCQEDGEYCDTKAKETILTKLVIGAEGNAGKRNSAIIKAMDEDKTCKTKMKKLRERIESTRVYKIVPIELPEGYRKDLNYSSRTKSGVAMECLPTKEGLLVGVLLIKPTDEETCMKVSDAKKLRAYFDSEFPMFTKMISDASVEKIANSKFCGLPNFQYASGALHRGSVAGLIGDAIHTVKPYFGMGVNSAFEDVAILEECIEESKGDSKKFLPLYSKKRAADAKALVQISHGFDGGFLTFVLPLILDGIFHKYAPWLFQVNTIQMLQKDDWSFVQTSRRKRVDRTLQVAIIASIFAGFMRLLIELVRFIVSKRSLLFSL
jgi:kynurenine 3-monooxygenase